MTYEYNCKKCKTTWEEGWPMDKRDTPTEIPCPHCNAEGSVTRLISPTKMSYQGRHGVQKLAGDGWNDVLKKIKTNAGPKSTIETR